mmetsp:Transcript_52628/g.104583  ORF Transcript_52628/g.104583 Transcript_52628/m.104583 type:complete len:143 (-) Transcript_52628:905-1333(-)
MPLSQPVPLCKLSAQLSCEHDGSEAGAGLTSMAKDFGAQPSLAMVTGDLLATIGVPAVAVGDASSITTAFGDASTIEGNTPALCGSTSGATGGSVAEAALPAAVSLAAAVCAFDGAAPPSSPLAPPPPCPLSSPFSSSPSPL